MIHRATDKDRDTDAGRNTGAHRDRDMNTDMDRAEISADWSATTRKFFPEGYDTPQEFAGYSPENCLEGSIHHWPVYGPRIISASFESLPVP